MARRSPGCGRMEREPSPARMWHAADAASARALTARVWTASAQRLLRGARRGA